MKCFRQGRESPYSRGGGISSTRMKGESGVSERKRVAWRWSALGTCSLKWVQIDNLVLGEHDERRAGRQRERRAGLGDLALGEHGGDLVLGEHAERRAGRQRDRRAGRQRERRARSRRELEHWHQETLVGEVVNSEGLAAEVRVIGDVEDSLGGWTEPMGCRDSRGHLVAVYCGEVVASLEVDPPRGALVAHLEDDDATFGVLPERETEGGFVAERRASSAAISPFAAVSSAAHGWTPPHTRAATFSTAVWPYDPALTWPMNSSA
eukprot:scaffold36361_cov64-Phaeocystis_antarctica.AAC.2